MPQLETDFAKSADPLSVEDYCFLANTFTDQREYEKAIQIYESACKLYPENLALKINLGRVRSLRNQAFESPRDILPSRKDAADRAPVWAHRFQGFGEVFLKRGRWEEAKRIFELSKSSQPDFYLPYLNLGRLFLEQGDVQHAIEELERSRTLNPFNEATLELLSTARFKNRGYLEALDCAIDALIVSGEAERPTAKGPHQNRIKQCLEKLPNMTAKMRNQRIHERRARINALYEELEIELKKMASPSKPEAPSPSTNIPEEIVEDTIVIADAPRPSPQEEQRRTDEMAALLRKHLIFRNMAEPAVMKIAQFTSLIHVPKSEFVYQEGDPIYGLYLINRGKVELQKNTPYDPIVFSTFEKGSFFGDDNLLSGRDRFTRALAIQDSDLLFIDKGGLATIFARQRSIAIHFLWYFWTSLSRQIREANDRMTSFFGGASQDQRKELLAPGGTASAGRPTHVEIDKKLEVLQTKGLSLKELNLLARFSNAEIYNRGENIFQEGDLGDRLYIVLEGAVLISKKIAGTGEEALSVLKKGDFFGEMALVGQHYRSADAKAQEQGTTVLVITKEALREILSIDTDSAYQFLTILCRILSQRLLEINEKIYQWRIMSGGFR